MTDCSSSEPGTTTAATPAAPVTGVVVAVDSFKGSIGAADAAHALAAGWRRRRPGDDVRVVPMADGGEGTLDALATALPGAERMPVTVSGPDGRSVEASWLLLPPDASHPFATAVVELAATSGIALVETLRPLDAHTRGFGQAIAAALDSGVSRLVLALGGSASTDGGTGMLAALGARFTAEGGGPIADGGRGLADLAHVDLGGLPALPPAGAVALADVASTLLGPRGAAAVFGPQKGADVADVAVLDEGLARLAELVGVDPDVRGSGAAGGTGYGLHAWGVDLVPGAPTVAALVGLAALVRAADLVVTGEGSYDAQTTQGKAPAFVTQLAADAGVPVALVAGRIAPDADVSGFVDAVSLIDLAGSSAAALGEPARWLAEAGEHLAIRRPLHPAGWESRGACGREVSSRE